MKSIYLKLINIQNELKAPKSQYNSFGKYKYRNAEDIMEALKPVLLKNKATVFISDEIVNINDRYYVKATATLVCTETGESIQTTAIAREEAEKKGMDGSQVTGASSSYARKYCLNGLFLIDDTKDSDFTNTHGKETSSNTYSHENTYSNNNSDELSYGTQSQSTYQLSPKQLNWLDSLCKKKNMTKEVAVQKYNQKFSTNISLTNLQRSDFDKLVEILQK